MATVVPFISGGVLPFRSAVCCSSSISSGRLRPGEGDLKGSDLAMPPYVFALFASVLPPPPGLLLSSSSGTAAPTLGLITCSVGQALSSSLCTSPSLPGMTMGELETRFERTCSPSAFTLEISPRESAMAATRGRCDRISTLLLSEKLEPCRMRYGRTALRFCEELSLAALLPLGLPLSSNSSMPTPDMDIAFIGVFPWSSLRKSSSGRAVAYLLEESLRAAMRRCALSTFRCSLCSRSSASLWSSSRSAGSDFCLEAMGSGLGIRSLGRRPTFSSTVGGAAAAAAAAAAVALALSLSFSHSAAAVAFAALTLSASAMAWALAASAAVSPLSSMSYSGRLRQGPRTFSFSSSPTGTSIAPPLSTRGLGERRSISSVSLPVSVSVSSVPLSLSLSLSLSVSVSVSDCDIEVSVAVSLVSMASGSDAADSAPVLQSAASSCLASSNSSRTITGFCVDRSSWIACKDTFSEYSSAMAKRSAVFASSTMRCLSSSSRTAPSSSVAISRWNMWNVASATTKSARGPSAKNQSSVRSVASQGRQRTKRHMNQGTVTRPTPPTFSLRLS
mmetsp:Transcript_13881/g.54833  ORF Transcript_13881/g.54833 Transcript_13881/m.54833 type:complete len:562 (-) Transcript_13881:1972-3657(-)